MTRDDTPYRGFSVRVGLSSDSGEISDLDAVDVSEVIETVTRTGVFEGAALFPGDRSWIGLKPSDYMTALETSQSFDEHAIPVQFIRIPGGQLVHQQTFEFRDRRTGSQDIPMANSGFTITYKVEYDSSSHGWICVESKRGTATTAHDRRGNMISSDAGVTRDHGGIETPITRTLYRRPL